MIWSQKSVLDLYIVLPWSGTVSEIKVLTMFLSSFGRDVGNVVEALYGDLPPPIMLIGHSMGGAIAVHTAVANLVPSLLGLCMIDVVEGKPEYPQYGFFFFSSPQIPEHRRFYPQTYANSILLTEITHVK